MMFARVVDGDVDLVTAPIEASIGGRWRNLKDADPAELAQAGWYQVVEVPRPADTDLTVHDPRWVFNGSTVVMSWVPRSRTPVEEREAEHAGLRLDLTKQIATLREWAAQADATIVTSTNAVQVLNVTVDRLGIFFDRFADLLDVLGFDD